MGFRERIFECKAKEDTNVSKWVHDFLALIHIVKNIKTKVYKFARKFTLEFILFTIMLMNNKNYFYSIRITKYHNIFYKKRSSCSSREGCQYRIIFQLSAGETGIRTILSAQVKFFEYFSSISRNTIFKILWLFFISKTLYWILLPYFLRSFENFVRVLSSWIS